MKKWQIVLGILHYIHGYLQFHVFHGEMQPILNNAPTIKTYLLLYEN